MLAGRSLEPRALPLHVHTMGEWGPMLEGNQLTAWSTASYNWPATELAVYIPVVVPWRYPVRRVFWANGSNVASPERMQFGIYSQQSGLIFATAEVAQSGASQLQYSDVTDFWLPPGLYYFALANDSATTTNRAWGNGNLTALEGRQAGLMQQALGAGGTLGEVATLASWASTGLPLCGITRTSTGF